MVIDCPNCRIMVDAVKVGEYQKIEEFSPDDGFKYEFMRCPKCYGPILTKCTLVYEFNAFDWGVPVKIYPEMKFHVNPSIPRELRDALIESIRCYEASLYTPTVIMCRRTLEGFCQVMGIPKNQNLQNALKTLKEKEIINAQLFEWATLLRDTGNQAAHNMESTFTQSDAKDLLDFTIAILDFCYSFKDKYSNFLKRQDAIKNAVKKTTNTSA